MKTDKTTFISEVTLRGMRVLPAILTVASILTCLAFSRFYLYESANQFERDFERQNYSELSMGDTYALTQRLNALSGAVHWECIIGARGTQVFYERRRGTCNPGLISKTITIRSDGADSIVLNFTLTLPKELQLGCLSFVLLQSMLLLSLIWSSKQTERARFEAERRFGLLAMQVAHDIRSPLAALMTVSHAATILDGEHKLLLKHASQRIKDIAEGLLSEGRAVAKSGNEGSISNLAASAEVRTLEHIPQLVGQIVSEKKAQFLPDSGIEVVSRSDSLEEEMLSFVPAVELSRVISNIVNNAVEAIADKGRVEIVTSLEHGYVVVVIADNGKGIPPAVVGQLGKRGLSFGKGHGTGLGLYHARVTLETIGGQLSIESKEGAGTRISLKIPAHEPPQWVCRSVSVQQCTQVVIVVPKQEIRDSIIQRLAGCGFSGDVRSFKSTREFQKWYGQNYASEFCNLYFISAEIGDTNVNGFELVEMLGIGENSVLVAVQAVPFEVAQRLMTLKCKVLFESSITRVSLL